MWVEKIKSYVYVYFIYYLEYGILTTHIKIF